MEVIDRYGHLAGECPLGQEFVVLFLGSVDHIRDRGPFDALISQPLRAYHHLVPPCCEVCFHIKYGRVREQRARR